MLFNIMKLVGKPSTWFCLSLFTLSSLVHAQQIDAPAPDDAPAGIVSPIIIQPPPSSNLSPGVAPPSGAPGATWQFLGPQPITGGQVEGLVNGEVVGSIHVVLPHPTDADIMYAGAVNGGIWKTTNATATNPNWIPLTDGLPSQSIAALVFDHADTTYNTVVAGIGRNSSYASFGGARTGLLRSTNGGTTWSSIDGGGILTGANISGVVVNGSTMVVAVSLADSFTYSNVGIFRSTDTGGTFTQISTGNGTATGLPGGVAFDLGNHPDDPAVIYTNIKFAPSVGGVNGIYKSIDTGASWNLVGSAVVNTLVNDGSTSNVEFAIHDSVGGNVVYAAILNSGQLEGGGIFRTVDGGVTWTEMDTPVTNEVNGGGSGIVGTNPRFKPDAGGPAPNSGMAGGQGAIHFSIVADPSNPNIVYVGGDRQPRGLNDTGSFPNSVGANNFTGRLFRGDASVGPNGGATAPSPQWKHLTHIVDAGGMIGGGTASGSAPHADSREMAFDANGDLIETDDGGIYRRTSPQDNTGDWFSINGDLGVTELHDISYDTVSNIYFGGAQDTGTPEQSSSGVFTWFSVSTADGGDVATDIGDVPNTSVRYSSFQNLGAFRRRVFDETNTLLSINFPSLTLTTGGSFDPAFVTPIATNFAEAGRLIIVGDNGVYESLNRGDSMALILSNFDLNFRQNAVAYGGFSGAIAKPNVLYVGLGSSIYVRSDVGTLALSQSFGGVVRDVVMDPEDWTIAALVTDTQILKTVDAGVTWVDVTGNYPDAISSTITFGPCGLDSCFYVGGANGVYESSATAPGSWIETGIGLPEVPIEDLNYDFEDSLLYLASFGRGAWQLSLAAMLPTCNGLPVTVDLVAGTGSVSSGDDVILGTSGIDIIDSLAGNDTICAGGGDDVVNAGGGDDWIDGGSGDDDITGSAGMDTIFGGIGDDVLFGGSGNDDIEGEEGDDTLFGQPGDDTIDGGDGVDEINGGGGNDTIYTGAGATVGSGVFVSGSGGDDTIYGGPDADDIKGSAGADIINGEGGDDLITGGTGRDTIDGGDGNDDIKGQGSRDTVNGGAGDDVLNGGDENDVVNGGSGDDAINGGPGNDILRGDSGADEVKGGSGNDTLVGGSSGGDVCNGQSGTDTAAASCESTVGVP